MTEERGLLIAGDAGDFSVRKKFGSDGKIAAGVDNFRQHGAGNVEDVEKLFIPDKRVDVEEQGARGVGDIGDVAMTAGEFPDEPGVDGAECELAGLRLHACAGNVLQYPANFASRKVGVEDETGFFCDERIDVAAIVIAGGKLGAIFCGAAILPDDGVGNGASGGSFPHDGSFALIGDADAVNGGGVKTSVAENGAHGGCLRGPDGFRVLFDPAGMRINLRQLPLSDVGQRAVIVHQHGARAAGPLIES